MKNYTKSNEIEDRPVYILPGEKITDLHSFFKVFGEMVNGPGGYFGNNSHAFDDCLFGGFGLEAPCQIIWKNAELSRQVLNHECLANWCIEAIDNEDYPDEEGLKYLQETLELAKQGLGETMFDVLIDTIQSVGERAIFSDTWQIALRLE